jgi:hypothetical protein
VRLGGTRLSVKRNAVPVTGRGGPYGCEMLRIPHYLGNRLTDGCKVVSPTRLPSFTHRNIPGTHFCYRLSEPQGLVRLEGLGQLKNPLTSGIEPATFRLVA